MDSGEHMWEVTLAESARGKFMCDSFRSENGLVYLDGSWPGIDGVTTWIIANKDYFVMAKRVSKKPEDADGSGTAKTA